MKKESLVVHGAAQEERWFGSVNVPIFQTSTYKQRALGDYDYEYSRTGNPTREVLEETIAQLEHGIGGLAFASGMAAIAAVLSLFKSGDSIIIADNLYGGSFRILDKVFKNFEIHYQIVDTSDLAATEAALQAGAGVYKAVLVETPTNPLMDITDIEAVSKLAQEYGALTIVDNTFMSPYLQTPLTLGADIVLHSATKYLGGHSNVVAGVVAVATQELYDRLAFIQNSTGGVLGPFDSYILLQGIKTLAVRMERHNENARQLAYYLQSQSYVEKVYYPGFEDAKGYEIQKKQASGFGGMISFVVNQEIDYKKFLQNLKLITLAESLGGVESLICHPASMTHAAIPAEIREKVGITESLLRLSVGIEHIDDLIEDLEQAIRAS
ncbi:MAG: trans-sulfuration enzyme family protein [Lachnospiraceae bacterium]